jgi:hypothetical protein
MIFLAPAHSYSLPVPASIAASLAIDQCQMHIQKKYDGVPPPRTRTDMRFAAALRRWRFSVMQRYCIVEVDRVAARPRARRLPLDERKPREES